MEITSIKPRPVRSLSATLAIAFISLSAVVLVVSQILQIIPTIQAQQALVASQQKLIANEASSTVSSSIQQKFSVLETAVKFGNPVTADAETRQRVLGSLLGLQPAFSQLALLDARGRQVAQVSRLSSTLSPKFKEQLNGDALVQAQEGQRYISPIYVDDATSEPLVSIAVPVQSSFREFQGTLVAELNLKFMWDLVDRLKVGETGYAYVVDSQGNLIAFGDTSRVLSGENVRHIDEVKEFVENPSLSADPTTEVLGYTGLLGKSVLGSYVPLGTPDWAVVTELPVTEAYQSVIQGIVRTLINILVMGILAGLAGYLVARRLAAPLIDLSGVANEIAGGNLAKEAKVAGPAEIALVATTFNAMTSELRAIFTSLEQRVKERTVELDAANQRNERRARQFESIAEVARAITSTQNLNTLLTQIATVISREFGYYHVGVFLLDSAGEFAILSGTNSEGGQNMLVRGHRLKVGEVGIVGYVTAKAKPRVALDTGADAVYFDNPDLPETRSEIALPLHVGGEIIGALDVQSTQAGAFSQEDVSILSTLADQVSIAIQNARQFDATRKALADAESLSRQFVQQGWVQFTQGQRIEGVHHNGATATLLYMQNGGEKEESRIDADRLRVKGTGALLSLPVKLRGEVIGSVDVRSPDNRQWDQDELDIVTAIIERSAIAMENARLLAESQRAAAKEHTIGVISAKIGAQSDVDELFKTAVQELNRALPGAEVAIQFRRERESE